MDDGQVESAGLLFIKLTKQINHKFSAAAATGLDRERFSNKNKILRNSAL